MKLLEARVNGVPRQVPTKYGEKAILEVATNEGAYTIWRPAGDNEVMARRNGERVTIAVNSKGKASLIEPAENRSVEIADYIERLGKLYRHCLTTAANLSSTTELNSAQTNDIAARLFVQTIQHFEL